MFKRMSTPISDMSGDSTLGTLSLRDKALIKRNINRHHNSNFKAGYVPVHEPSLGRTGVRGRKTVVLWALVLLLFALAAANLCLTLTILGVLRVGHGMEAIEFLSELGIMKFRGIADLDRVTKRDGRIQGFAGSPVEISGDGGSVLFDLGASVGPRISLDEEGISMTGLESLDVLLHGSRGSVSAGGPGGPPRGTPAVFSTRFPNFGLPRGVRRLDVASATAKRLSAPVGASLRLKSTSRVRLRGSEGASLDGRELAWSADQDILLRSVNGSILLNGTNGVALDVRSVPLVPLPPPNHVAMLRRMRAVGNGERGDGVAMDDGNAHVRERKLRRFEHKCYYQLESYHREKSSAQLETSRRLHHPTKNESPPCHTSVPRNSKSWRPRVNVSVPYSMLNCHCHECRRSKTYPGERMEKPYERAMFHEEDACFPIECLGKLADTQKIEKEIYRITPNPRGGGANKPPPLREFEKDEALQDFQSPWESEYMDTISSTGEKIMKEKIHETKPKVAKKMKT